MLNFHLTESGYPFTVEPGQGPRCGNHGRRTIRHETPAAIKYCYALDAEQRAQIETELAAERAMEQAIENQGFWDARAQEDYEAAHGIVDFVTDWHAASPETAPAR